MLRRETHREERGREWRGEGVRTRMHATKLVVRDLDSAERFYTALGLEVVGRNLGGEGNVHQAQTWLSTTGEEGAHILILSQFPGLPPPTRPEYPGEIWTCYLVEDVDATAQKAVSLGGELFHAGEDRPEHQVRAAVVRDPEGHVIELVGPMKNGASQ
jgi:catechol 2,3-dioxygenase-like lactoylglutathione lyase family enzyme